MKWLKRLFGRERQDASPLPETQDRTADLSRTMPGKETVFREHLRAYAERQQSYRTQRQTGLHISFSGGAEMLNTLVVAYLNAEKKGTSPKKIEIANKFLLDDMMESHFRIVDMNKNYGYSFPTLPFPIWQDKENRLRFLDALLTISPEADIFRLVF